METPRRSPEEVYDAYKDKVHNLEIKRLTPEDDVYDQVEDAAMTEIIPQELQDDPRVKEIIDRYNAARQELDFAIIDGQFYSHDNLDTLIPEAKAEMDAEMQLREAAQSAEPVEYRDPNAEATTHQASVIAALVRRNIPKLGQTFVLPNDMILTVRKAHADIDDIFGNQYTYVIGVEPNGRLKASGTDAGVATNYYVNDQAIEQQIILPIDESKMDIDFQELIKQFIQHIDSVRDEWEMERQLGLHRVTANEAESLAELLRKDWPQISLLDAVQTVPLPDTAELPTRQQLAAFKELIKHKLLTDRGTDTVYVKDGRRIHVQASADPYHQYDPSKETSIFDKMGVDFAHDMPMTSSKYCVMIAEDVEYLDNGYKLTKEITYQLDPPHFEEELVIYDHNGDRVYDASQTGMDEDEEDPIQSLKNYFKTRMQLDSDTRAAGLAGPLTDDKIEEITRLLNSLGSADLATS